MNVLPWTRVEDDFLDKNIRLMSPIVALLGCNPVSGCSDSPSSCSGQPYRDLVVAQTRLLSE